ncbi:MAG: HD domain-containing protein [Lachnospiraceae bacterium]|nr:HD domain-containing protein [Lachnospiraceae bacterium]
MEYLYLICLIVAIGMLVWLRIFDVRNSVPQYLNLIIVIISSLGYYFMSISRTLEEALFAQIVGYVGGVFLPIFYFFLVLELCHFELSKFVKIILVLCQGGIYGFVCTIGRGELFYKSAEMHIDNGMVVLEKVYGPFHVLAIGSMYLYLLLSFVVVIYSLAKKKSVDRKNAISMLVLMAIATGVYAMEKALKMEYTIIPLAYDVLMLGALIPIYDSNIYTVYENKNIINEQLGNVGFLTFDKNKAYKGCNNYMEKIFPELSQCRFGQIIKNSSQDLQCVIEKINNIEESYKSSLHKEHIHLKISALLINDRYYDGMIHILTNSFRKLKGYTIEIRDNTEHYKTLALKERYNDELAKEVEAKTSKIKSIQEKTILGMAQMVESRDLSTGGHIKRTSDVVRIFAKKLVNADLGLTSEFLNLVIRSAPMHDLGKIGVDDAVLRKQGKFTDEEYDKMKKHSEIGYHMVNEILSDVEDPDFVHVAENVAHYHHEKINGTGYPEGLKGEEIPIEARIMALADVFDALVSKRCYKDAFSYERAYEIIEKDAGTHFDKHLAMVFLSCKEELENYYNASEK